MSTPAQRMERELRRLVEEADGLAREASTAPDVEVSRWWIDSLRETAEEVADRARRIPDLARLCPRCAGEGDCPCP